MTSPDTGDDFVADRHSDLDAGEYGGMADADYYDCTADRRPDTTDRCPSCGHARVIPARLGKPGCDGAECSWCPEGYCEDVAGMLKAEGDFAADLGPEA